MTSQAETPRPVKQEQLPADPEVREVAPGVLRLQLPIELPGLKHVNTYAIVGPSDIAVVDPGLPGPISWKHLQSRLAQAGLANKHIAKVLITHSHPDHFGNAGRLAKKAGAELLTHRAFQMSWNPVAHNCTADDCDDPAHPHVEDGQEPLNTESRAFGSVPPWGGDTYLPVKRSFKHRLIRYAESAPVLRKVMPTPRPTGRLRNGQPVLLGGREWIAVHTPGHTPDHLCLFDPEHGTFISGDHVLPTITPHISGMGMGSDPLRAFFESLDHVAALPGVRTVLPAHGGTFADLAGRVADIKGHHLERLELLLQASAALGPQTVEEFSRALFRPERLGSMASSETYAHLEHLRFAGRAERTNDHAGRAVYRVLH